MNERMHSNLARLISDALIPDRLIAYEDLAKAQGYLYGLLEGGAMSPVEFTEYHHQIHAARKEVVRLTMVKLGIVA